MGESTRTVCWKPLWHERLAAAGFEHCRIGATSADAVVAACDEEGAPYRLEYQLEWNSDWQIRDARLSVTDGAGIRRHHLATDGAESTRPRIRRLER